MEMSMTLGHLPVDIRNTVPGGIDDYLVGILGNVTAGIQFGASILVEPPAP